MKKLLVLMVFAGLFLFGAITVQASLGPCGISKFDLYKDSDYTHADGNLWYNADEDGSTIFYELDYDYSKFKKPVTSNWGNNIGLMYHFMFDEGYTVYGNIKSWQEAIFPAGKITGEFCLWSDTHAERIWTTGLVAIYGGVNRDDIRTNSADII